MKTPYIFRNLSNRSKRVISELGICDVESFLKITREDLNEVWSCGKNTILEIQKLQSEIKKDNQPNAKLEVEPPGGEKNEFFEELSVRAKRVLEKLDVNDPEALLLLSADKLVGVEGCGIKTIAEIESCKSRIISKNEEGCLLKPAIKSCMDFAGAPDELFKAVKKALSVRGERVLESLDIISLQEFMELNRIQLLNCRNCGRKTASEILMIQDGLIDYAKALSKNTGDFDIGRLLSAPCLLGSDFSIPTNPNSKNDLLIDTDNPSRWLREWVRNLSSSEKVAQAFMLRKGMEGTIPKTLEEVGKHVGNITRERVRQIEMSIEKKAFLAQQQQRIVPLIDIAVDIVGRKGGLISLEELTEELFCKGLEGEFLKFATGLIEFFSKFKVWKERGLILKKDGTVRNKEYSSLLQILSRDVAKIALEAADEIISSDLWSVDREILIRKLSNNESIRRRHLTPLELSDSIFDVIMKKCRKHIRSRGDRVYSIHLWKIRFGKVLDFAETILRLSDKPLHFSEVQEIALRYGRKFNENNVHAALDRSKKALLWDRGVFFYKDKIVIPFSLVHDVEDWLRKKLTEDDVPFVSVYGAFIQFRNRCQNAGLYSETALYTCLRQSAHPDLIYPKLPFVYLKKGFTERLPVVVAFEDFLREAGGPVTSKEAEGYAIEKLCLKDFQYDQLKYAISNVVRISDSRYLHIENAEFDEESVFSLVEHIKDVIVREEHCSIEKIYSEKVITCKSSGIDSPAMLYSLLQYYAEDEIALNGYPLISMPQSEEQYASTSIKSRVLEFVRNQEKPCSLKLLDDVFVEKHGYKESTVYSAVRSEEVCMYHTGCVIHLSAVDWDDKKQKALEEAAFALYERAVKAGSFFAKISRLVESSKLPELPSAYDWSETMVSNLLIKGKNFYVLGNAQEVFLPKKNEFKIYNFESLIGKILEKNWGGAANHRAFETAISRAGIVKRNLTSAMLGSGRIVAIKNGEIFFKELLADVERPRFETRV